MVCVVAEEDAAVVFDFEIETTVYSSKGEHCCANFFSSNTRQLSKCASCNTIVNVDAHRNSQFDVGDVA